MQKGTRIEGRDPSLTIQLLLKASEAVALAVRQMPNELLNWSVPERNRTMREFTHHIFNHVTMAMADHPNDRGLKQISSEYTSYRSFKQIADYGETVIEIFRFWAAKQDLNELRKSSSESKSRAERLDVDTGAVIQHLRQLYFILENFRIEPEPRIPDSEWPSEYALSILW